MVDGIVYVFTTQAECALVRRADRQVVTRLELPGEVANAPLLADRILVVTTRNGHVVGIDTRRRTIAWRTRIGDRIASGAVLIGERVVAATDEGNVVGLDVASGEPVWKQTLTGEVTLDLTVVGNRAVIASLQTLYTFEQNGDPGPEFDAGSILCTAPRGIGPYLLVGTRANQVLVLDGASLRLEYEVQGTEPPTAPAAPYAGTRAAIVVFGREARGIRLDR